jgi:ATP-dependent protease ClpP protease subunit
VLLAAGAKGKRYALPNSLIRSTRARAAPGQRSDAVIQMRSGNIWSRSTTASRRHTGQPLDRVTKDTDRDHFMSPEDAKDYGIIDAVYAVENSSLIAQAHDAGRAGGEGSAVAEVSEAGEPAQKKSKAG